MQHPYTAVRPAVPDSLYGRRRTNSTIPPAVPLMSNVPPPPLPPQYHYSQPPLQSQYQYQYHPLMPVAPTLPVQHRPPPPPPPPPPPSPQPSISTPQPGSVIRTHFKPPLPWLSCPDQPFPSRRRRRRRLLPPFPPPLQPRAPTLAPQPTPEPSTAPSASEVATPQTTNPPSEVDSTHPTTPSSTAPPSTAASVTTKPAPTVPVTPPAVPIITPKPKAVKAQKDEKRPQPVLTEVSAGGEAAPVTPSTQATAPATLVTQDAAPAPAAAPTPAAKIEPEATAAPTPATKPEPEATAAPAPAAPAKPASWADLLKSENQKTARAVPSQARMNGPVNGLYSSLDEALKAFQIRGDAITTPFLEPRGLVNTGNMCFMNAVLQMLLYCGPFYYFLDRVSASAKNIKDNTPLIEAMIMFMREFRIVTKDSKSKIKSDDLEALGEPFAPEYFYETIRKLKRFSHMSRGHQQDAEEFLGFLLDGLHEEAVGVMKKVESSAVSKSKNEDNGWLEVGHKQKTATTRTTEISESPITKIFGGKLKSVFSVPGLKNSVTLEPYTPLQLDIHAPGVNSVVDALKYLTTPEKIHGDFKSPKGPNVTATKQVSIETLPPVLILHLKRFQYDNTGGTQKIWKKIAYPLELEIPREAMSTTIRRAAPPRYRLIGVVYHHGSSAQGGHYTADVLRQDARNWIRLDDTSIQIVASKAVAVDVKDISKYNDFDSEDQEGWVNNWEQVSGSGSSGSGRDKCESKRYVGKDSRTAYILFYQKI